MEELILIREVLDPKALRDKEVPAHDRQLLRTPLTELTGVRHPVVQTGMGWVSGPRLVTGTANAGGLGILASATMTVRGARAARSSRSRSRTDQPFGVNLRADAGDAPDRCDLLIKHGVKVASFALAPKQELIAKLKDHGIVVMPSIGAARHAEKVAAWGADAVMIQGGEGGGHTGTGARPRCCCRRCSTPSTSRSSPPAASSTAAASPPRCRTAPPASAWAPASCSPSDSAVPDAVKQLYLDADLNGTVVTAKVDGMPHRMLRTDLVEELEETSALKRLGPTAAPHAGVQADERHVLARAGQGRPRDEEGAGPHPRPR